jgi:hypothetical protein
VGEVAEMGNAGKDARIRAEKSNKVERSSSERGNYTAANQSRVSVLKIIVVATIGFLNSQCTRANQLH